MPRWTGRIMKRFWIEIVLAMFVMGCGMGFPPQAHAGTLTGGITYTYSSTSYVDSNGNWPACTSQVIIECVTGFKVYDTTSGSPVSLGTVPNPAGASGIVSITYNLTLTNPSYGTHTIYERAQGISASGTAVESANSNTQNFNVPAPAQPLAGALGLPTYK